MTLLLSDKIDSRAKKVMRDREGHDTMIKELNSPRRYKNLKCVCTKLKNWKICKATTNRTKREIYHL